MIPSKSLLFVPSEDPTALGRSLLALSRETPLYFDTGLGLPVLLRKAHCTVALRDTERFSTRMFQGGILNGGLASLQGEEHTRMRRVYDMFFTKRAVQRYEERITVPIVEEVLTRLSGKDHVDLLDAFAAEMPRRVISALFGFSMAQLAENDARVRAMFRSIIRVGDPIAAAEGAKAYEEALGEITEVAERERKHPSETLLGEIMRTLTAEDMATLEACQQIVLSLLLGGYETTIWLIANAIHALLAHPDVMDKLRQDPSLVPFAVEESMRWAPSSVGTLRLAEQDATFDGVEVKAGTVFYIAPITMHYDEETYPSPERFDLARRSTPMIFGGGPHFCVGAPLARMEARVGLTLLLQRFPALRADPSVKPVFSYGVRESVLHGPDTLPAFLR